MPDPKEEKKRTVKATIAKYAYFNALIEQYPALPASSMI